MSGNITLTSKVGKFVFFPDVNLAHAKIVRDSVMGQILSPVNNGVRIKTGAHAVNYIRSYLGGSVADTPFSFYPTPKTR